MNRTKTGITIEVNDDDETITALYDHDTYPSGVNINDVEAYWSDDEISEAVSEMNHIEKEMVEVTHA